MLRRRSIQIFFCFLFSMYAAGLAHAAEFYLTGSDLYKMCKSSKADDAASCHSFLLGVLDGRVTYMGERIDVDGGKSPPIGICFPNKGLTMDDLRIAVIREIDSNHELFDTARAGYSVIKAIKSSFPCPASYMGPATLQK